ncbi:hypothetical protein PBS_33410 [Paraburkholderia sp. 2C]
MVAIEAASASGPGPASGGGGAGGIGDPATGGGAASAATGGADGVAAGCAAQPALAASKAANNAIRKLGDRVDCMMGSFRVAKSLVQSPCHPRHADGSTRYATKPGGGVKKPDSACPVSRRWDVHAEASDIPSAAMRV